MQLSNDQIRHFDEHGYLILPSWFHSHTIAAIRDEVLTSMEHDGPERVQEQDRQAVRAIHGCHLTNDLFASLAQCELLVEPARQLLRSEVYLYQFKANTKAAFVGDYWEWHQDFAFWHREDLLPASRILSMTLFLDEVNEFNGPLLLIPKSHHEGLIEIEATQEKPAGYEDHPDWISGFTKGLRYALPPHVIKTLVAQQGIVAPKGAAGSVLIFHANTVHGSGVNISPFDRYLCLLTYSSANNVPLQLQNQRPEFMVSRDFTPIESGVPEASLLSNRHRLSVQGSS